MSPMGIRTHADWPCHPSETGVAHRKSFLMHINPTSPVQKRGGGGSTLKGVPPVSTKTISRSSSVLKATSQIFTYAWYRDDSHLMGYIVGVLFCCFLCHGIHSTEPQATTQFNASLLRPSLPATTFVECIIRKKTCKKQAKS